MQFVPTAEGYVNVLGNVLDDNKTFHYVYNYTDHLGNVRVSYAWDDKEQKAKILNENHFYAFGGKHRGYTGLISTPAIIEEGVAIESGGLQVISTQYSGSNTFHYAYNSKELQTESGFYDYGWRQYMPDIGRWNGIDQLAEHYNSINPYAYVANNPVSFTDPDGRRIDRDINGNYTFTGFDALMLESYLSAGGDYGQLIGSLNSYNGGDFGSGIISHFWLNFKTDVLSNIKINSQLNTVSWIVNAQSTGAESDNFLKGVIELKEAYINVGKHVIEKNFYLNVVERNFNGILDYTEVGVKGYKKIPHHVKRHYAYKLSKFTDIKSGEIYQKTKGFVNKTGKFVTKAGNYGNVASVAVGVVDVLDDGNIKASTVVNMSLLAVGLAFPVTAPFILAYGVLDFTFDISGRIDNNFNGIDTGIYDK
ncbi:RHS repeat-associated core domain-containing protein [Vaginella massiliensis]|uniref:RHS repeat-associated core domain-containing protein n=1 Tax=Vaginella massiliensis TaxID=1816680 RepID=UPI003750B7D1